MKLKDRVIITGALSGIGLAISTEFTIGSRRGTNFILAALHYFTLCDKAQHLQNS